MAIALYPWLIATEDEKQNKVLMNHEKIHLQQEKEGLWIFFLIPFILNGLWTLWTTWDVNKMYKASLFESEAYANENDMEYLKKRKFWQVLFDKKAKEYRKKIRSEKTTTTGRIGGIVLGGTLLFFVSLFIYIMIKM